MVKGTAECPSLIVVDIYDDGTYRTQVGLKINYGKVPKQIPSIDQENQKKDNEQKVAKTVEPIKVTKLLVQQGYINEVTNISLDIDKQIYKVHGRKRAKLFLFIPVQLTIQLTVDATTGSIMEINKPWWAFLTR